MNLSGLKILIFSIGLVFLPVTVWGAMSSTNYTIYADFFDLGGNYSTSSSYIITDSSGQIPGSMSGLNYSLIGGFQGMSRGECGNNIKEDGEQCDGVDLNGQTCITQGFSGGTLSCNSNCTFNSVLCTRGGGGAPGDPGPIDNPPLISNLSAQASVAGAVITWNASDDKAITSVSLSYGVSPLDNTIFLPISVEAGGNYSKTISGLVPNTDYSYKITVSDGKNPAVTGQGTFKTNLEIDTKAPVISGITVVPAMYGVEIGWQTDEPADSKVGYGKNNSDENTIVQDANPKVLSHKIIITGLKTNQTYYYRIFSQDASKNIAYSGISTFKTLADITAPANVADLKIAIVENSLKLTWTNPVDADLAGIKIVKKIGSIPENKTDGAQIYSGSGTQVIDNSVSKNVRYYYKVFSFDLAGNYSNGLAVEGIINEIIPPEVCNNNIDDDADGAIDCADTDCFANPVCQIIEPPQEPPKDPPQEPPIPEQKINPGGGREAQKIAAGDFYFSGANGKISLSVQNGKLYSLGGYIVLVAIPKSKISLPVKSIALVIKGEKNILVESSNNYEGAFVFPPVGSHQAHFEINYEENKSDISQLILESPALGLVVDDKNASLAGVEVSLYFENQLFNASAYGQTNPIITDSSGVYGWLLPNGNYSLVLKKEGYFERKQFFNVGNNVLNANLQLIKRPLKLEEVIDQNASLSENIANVAENLVQQTQVAVARVGQKIQETVDNPAVEKTTERLVAPATLGVVAASTLPFLTFADVLPFMRLLFLQPLLLLGLRRRKKWGEVYNSLDKQPVDLAMIRLIDVATNRVVQSKVTDRQGRYAFFVKSGIYRIEVQKNNFIFPSSLLKNYHEDGRRVDLYHGEEIDVSDQDAVITANIPLDLYSVQEKPRRLRREKILRTIQSLLSAAGLLVTAASLYISPKWYIWLLLVLHICLNVVFRRLSKPLKVKGWGIVYDAQNKRPIGRTIARLFNAEFNKLVSSEVTDGKGRYFFLAGDGKYYVSFEHQDYQPKITETLDLTGKQDDVVAVDVELDKPGPVV